MTGCIFISSTTCLSNKSRDSSLPFLAPRGNSSSRSSTSFFCDDRARAPSRISASDSNSSCPSPNISSTAALALLSESDIITNALRRTSLPFIKYISNAANKLINSPFLLCIICSPSISVLYMRSSRDTAPVNSKFIFVFTKYMRPVGQIYNIFLIPSALSVTV